MWCRVCKELFSALLDFKGCGTNPQKVSREDEARHVRQAQLPSLMELLSHPLLTVDLPPLFPPCPLRNEAQLDFCIQGQDSGNGHGEGVMQAHTGSH